MSSPAITIISLPQKFEDILVKNENALSLVRQVIKPYSVILKSNRMEFFPEYTDHSINHVEEVLKTAEMLIPDDIFVKLTPEDIGVMVISVALHDIGMQTSADMFKNMINGQYNDARVEEFDKDTWSKLWEDYKKGSLYWDSEKKENVFGNKNYKIKDLKLKDLQKLNNYQKKFIGDFIRIYHCRIAHEIAKKGYIGKDHIKNECDDDFLTYLDLAGLVARSHGIDMRNTFNYLKKNFDEDIWATPSNVHVIYLMALLRIADYLQIDKYRTNENMLKAREMYSPYSRLEHETHIAIKNLNYKELKETIIVQAEPKNARTHVKIAELVKDIQREFDQTWAIIGEAYGKDFTLKYRRIKPTFNYPQNRKYVPQQFSYRFNDNLAKKLVGPLYDNNPSFGVRELVQNAVDACRECKEWDEKDPPHVVVKLDTKKKKFTITDTGKGMTLEEIQKYFLTIGSSFNDNVDWKKWRDDNKVFRSGRFGIGVLAAFLLGDKITVETRSKEAETGYTFEAELDDKFIEIQKNDELKRGTTITIKCNSESVEKLKEEAELEDKQYGTDQWYSWYIDENPEVTYFCDGTPIIPKRDKLKGFLELKHQSKDFGIIRWKPRFMGGAFLYCNGFFITHRANKHLFTDDDERYVISGYPHLQITDKYNKLPINLQRTNIESDAKYTKVSHP